MLVWLDVLPGARPACVQPRRGELARSSGDRRRGAPCPGGLGRLLFGAGCQPYPGRAFLPEENQKPGAHPVVVLSDRLWRRRFQADPGVVGRTLALNATVFTVIGVAPADFIGTGNPPQVPDFWAPLMMQAQLSPGFAWLERPNIHRLQLLARSHRADRSPRHGPNSRCLPLR